MEHFPSFVFEGVGKAGVCTEYVQNCVQKRYDHQDNILNEICISTSAQVLVVYKNEADRLTKFGVL